MCTRRSFTIKEKSVIIARREKGDSNAVLSREFKVPHSTISTIWKNRHKIQENTLNKSLKRKKMRGSNYQDIEDALLSWCKSEQVRNVPINSRTLLDKANEFAKLLDKRNFHCSESWIFRFRRRNNIDVGKISDEPVAVSQTEENEEVKESPENSEHLIKNENAGEEIASSDHKKELPAERISFEIPTVKDALNAVSILKKFAFFGQGGENLDINSIVDIERKIINVKYLNKRLKQQNN